MTKKTFKTHCLKSVGYMYNFKPVSSNVYTSLGYWSINDATLLGPWFSPVSLELWFSRCRQRYSHTDEKRTHSSGTVLSALIFTGSYSDIAAECYKTLCQIFGCLMTPDLYYCCYKKSDQSVQIELVIQAGLFGF